MRTVDVYNSNYVTNATNVKNALETYGSDWFSSVVLDTESDTGHAHVKCYIESQETAVFDMDFVASGNLVYHVGSNAIVGNYSHYRMQSIIFTDNGIVLKRRSNTMSSADYNDTLIIGKDVSGSLCGYYMSLAGNRYTMQYDCNLSGAILYPVLFKLTSPVFSWQIQAYVELNDANAPYVIAYPFVSNVTVSDKIWRIQDSFYYTAKAAPFTVYMNGKTYLTLANGSMIIETA